MLDAAYVRDHIEVVRDGLRSRGLEPDAELEQIASLEARRRRLIPEMEGLKREQNASGDEVARAKRQGIDASPVFAANKARAQRIRQLENEVDSVEHQRAALLMNLPNLPHSSVPVGASAADNVEVRRHLDPQPFDFEPRPHWEIGPALGILDFERATKMSGSRFSVLLGAGARLARALINFMLDLHTREHGYLEVEPPFLVNADALRGTGNLPKFEQDLFKIAGEWDLYLIPTAEVPLTNLHRGEILDGRVLPLRYTAYTPCFRSEAGSYGADVRGLIRQHQFDKVELVKFSHPDHSYEELESLTLNAEEQIASTYAASFGRAADSAGFEFWVGEFNRDLPVQGAGALFANIASSFGVSTEAKALYPFLGSPFGASDGQISAFLDSVYNNIFNRSSEAAGLA